MGVKVTTRGTKNEIDVNAILDFVSAQAVGLIQRRTARGIGSDGAAFDAYSPLYALQLRSVGENTKVDLTRSGAYLASISERSRVVRPDGSGFVRIGPGTGTSPVMPLPPPYVFDESKSTAERAEALASWRAAPKHAGRSPPHNVLGSILEEQRPHLGLTPEERKRLAAQITRIALKR